MAELWELDSMSDNQPEPTAKVGLNDDTQKQLDKGIQGGSAFPGKRGAIEPTRVTSIGRGGAVSYHNIGESPSAIATRERAGVTPYAPITNATPEGGSFTTADLAGFRFGSGTSVTENPADRLSRGPVTPAPTGSAATVPTPVPDGTIPSILKNATPAPTKSNTVTLGGTNTAPAPAAININYDTPSEIRAGRMGGPAPAAPATGLGRSIEQNARQLEGKDWVGSVTGTSGYPDQGSVGQQLSEGLNWFMNLFSSPAEGATSPSQTSAPGQSPTDRFVEAGVRNFERTKKGAKQETTPVAQEKQAREEAVATQKGQGFPVEYQQGRALDALLNASNQAMGNAPTMGDVADQAMYYNQQDEMRRAENTRNSLINELEAKLRRGGGMDDGTLAGRIAEGNYINNIINQIKGLSGQAYQSEASANNRAGQQTTRTGNALQALGTGATAEGSLWEESIKGNEKLTRMKDNQRMVTAVLNKTLETSKDARKNFNKAKWDWESRNPGQTFPYKDANEFAIAYMEESLRKLFDTLQALGLEDTMGNTLSELQESYRR